MRVLLQFLTLLLMTAVAHGQEVRSDWNRVTTLTPGDRIHVKVMGKRVAFRGQFVRMTPDSITIHFRRRADLTIPRPEVRSVGRVSKKKVIRNILIGVAISAGTGVGIAAIGAEDSVLGYAALLTGATIIPETLLLLQVLPSTDTIYQIPVTR